MQGSKCLNLQDWLVFEESYNACYLFPCRWPGFTSEDTPQVNIKQQCDQLLKDASSLLLFQV
jgi:hypothetical protein